MNPAYAAYNLIGMGLFFSLFPPFLLYSRLTGKYRRQMTQRLGRYNDRTLGHIQGAPRIWIHAVSVGEVTAAAAIIEALKESFPQGAIILSTITEQGFEVARSRYESLATCILAPIDTVFSTRFSIRAIRPDILVLVETELWPIWLQETRRHGIPAVLVNGRLSVRSFSGYMKIRPLMRSVFANIDILSMISQEDALRIQRMGADPSRIRIHGNAKYDGLIEATSEAVRQEMARLFHLNGTEPVLVAGSTRRTEEEMVITAFRQVRRNRGDAVLILAPRHLSKLPGIITMLNRTGMAYQLRSELDEPGVRRRAPVVVLDTMGELFSVYSIATVVFCGGSLVPLGGQNVLEPAAWGKPVLYGPSMDDFLDAKQLLETFGGGIPVNSVSTLAETVQGLFDDSARATAVGQRALQAVSRNQGAGKRHAGEVVRCLATGGGI